MSYNQNTKSGSFQKKSAPVATDGTKTEAKLVGSLHVQKNGTEDRVRLTGLFRDVSKAGKEYMRGKDEEGNKYIIFLD